MTLKNFIIGYGSLFNKKSLQRTLPEVTAYEPIYLNNYIRSWNAIENKMPTFSSTFLGVERRTDSKINAVIFEVSEGLLPKIDKREFLYRREKIDIEDIEFTSNCFNIDVHDNIWIYITECPDKPSPEYPIIQSYVDICLSGCLQIEAEYQLKNFAKDFIGLTENWSAHWVNDRIYPRAPHIHEPDAYQIDTLLDAHVNAFFKNIVIE